MSYRKIMGGSTSFSAPLLVSDTSSSTGAGLSGLVFNTSGLVAEYRRQGQSAWTSITLSAGTLGTWSSGGWVADGAAGGAYELGVPNAAVASGVQWVVVRCYGAANMLLTAIHIELDAVNYQDATKFGLANLDAAVSTRLATSGYTVPPTTGAIAVAVMSDVSDTVGADVATIATGTATLLTRVTGTVALASQIPPNFTTALFASAGVFSVGALANAPTGGGGSDPWATALPGGYTAGQAGYILGHPLVSTLAANGLDAVIVETGMNARQALSPIAAASAGVLSGAGSGTIVIKGANVATTRITATVDGAGNRTGIVLNLPT